MTNELGSVPIKVFGIGGGGVNAVNTMIQSGLEGVEFIAANTDAQNLNISDANVKLNIGVEISSGEGIGGDPEKGRQATEAHADEIRKTLEGARLVLITTGEGGGTGSGGAPVVAKISKEMGILTIGVVTTPFSLEQQQRISIAEKGVELLKAEVDALIVISNDKLLSLADDNLDYTTALKMSDNILHTCVEAVTEIIQKHYTPNIDFRDIDRLARNIGNLRIGIGKASGESRAKKAVKNALDDPLLNNKITNAKGTIVGIQSNTNFGLRELNELMEPIQQMIDPQAWLKFGNTVDESLGEEIRVIIITSGFDQEPIREFQPNQSVNQSFQYPPNPAYTSQNPQSSVMSSFPSGINSAIPNMTGAIPAVEKPAPAQSPIHKELEDQALTEAIEVPNSASNRAIDPISGEVKKPTSSSLDIPPFLN